MESLNKIVSLIKKTGDKAIVLDTNGYPGYVMMTIADYERLILSKSDIKGLTEDELLDKINRDIEMWKDSNESEHFPIDQHDFSVDLEKKESSMPDSGFNNIPVPALFEDFSLNLDKNDDEEEEDRYYFEPVE
jgi:hypothetical protein